MIARTDPAVLTPYADPVEFCGAFTNNNAGSHGVAGCLDWNINIQNLIINLI
jgi:hypothetical protein